MYFSMLYRFTHKTHKYMYFTHCIVLRNSSTSFCLSHNFMICTFLCLSHSFMMCTSLCQRHNFMMCISLCLSHKFMILMMFTPLCQRHNFMIRTKLHSICARLCTPCSEEWWHACLRPQGDVVAKSGGHGQGTPHMTRKVGRVISKFCQKHLYGSGVGHDDLPVRCW